MKDNRPVFTGQSLSFADTVDMLRRQGLIVDDEKRAIHILGNVAYCRLKPYMIPFMADRATHKFKPGASFEQVYAVYGFDRRLRELIFHEMEKIEISVRTRFGYATARSENGYWFTNPRFFRNPRSHERLLKKIYNEIERSDNDAIVRFRQKYSNEFPPCWMTLEATSMGTLVTIYEQMAPGPEKSAISSYFGLDDGTFLSWLENLVYVRNYCAHHNRLWDKTLSVRGRLPATPRNYFPELTGKSLSHVYSTLCFLKYLINTVKPANTFSIRLMALIDGFPTIRVESQMGFPENWREDPLWK